MEMKEGIKKLEELKQKASLGGGKERIEKLRREGYLLAEERVNLFLDPGTFVEFGTLAGPQPAEFGPPPAYVPRDGVITGFGQVDGRNVGVFAHDKTVQGGSLGNVQAAKISTLIRRASELKVPIIALQDSVGARIQEGNKNVGFDSIFFALTQASGVIPLISAILGRCAGGIAYSSALMDFILMVQGKSQLFITGPEVIKAVTHEEVSFEALGGAAVHSEKSGVCDLVASDEARAMAMIKELLSFLPGSYLDQPPRGPSRDCPEGAMEKIREIIPADPKKFYDMRRSCGACWTTGISSKASPSLPETSSPDSGG